MFVRKTESFVCEQCGTHVQGDGYTNHCPECLTSKHVDVDPGDRAATCGGLMDVTHIEVKHGEYVLTHTCRTCGYVRKNKWQAGDNIYTLIRLQQQLNDQIAKV